MSFPCLSLAPSGPYSLQEPSCPADAGAGKTFCLVRALSRETSQSTYNAQSQKVEARALDHALLDHFISTRFVGPTEPFAILPAEVNPEMAVDDTYVLTVSSRSPAGVMQNSLAFNRTIETAPIAGDFATVAIAMKDLYRTSQSTGVTYVGWRARQVRGAGVTWPAGPDCNPIGGNLFEGLFTTNTTGGNPIGMLPAQCAMVVTMKTAQIGRRHRGRNYFSGLTEDNQDAGTWSGSLLTTIDANWLAFYNTYTPAAPVSGFRLGVWSYRTASGCAPNPVTHVHERVDPPSPATAFTPALTYTVRPTVYTQRRRVAGVGM